MITDLLIGLIGYLKFKCKKRKYFEIIYHRILISNKNFTLFENQGTFIY